MPRTPTKSFEKGNRSIDLLPFSRLKRKFREFIKNLSVGHEAKPPPIKLYIPNSHLRSLSPACRGRDVCEARVAVRSTHRVWPGHGTRGIKVRRYETAAQKCRSVPSPKKGIVCPWRKIFNCVFYGNLFDTFIIHGRCDFVSVIAKFITPRQTFRMSVGG